MSDRFTYSTLPNDSQIANCPHGFSAREEKPRPFVVASRERDTEQDFAPSFIPTHRPKYAPGIYTLRCVAVRLRHMFGAHKCELEFEFPGTTNRVRAYLHMGRGPKPAVTAGSRYTQLWQEVTGRRSTRSTRMSAKVFRWVFFECEVGDCTKTHNGGNQEAYSRVQNILRAVQS